MPFSYSLDGMTKKMNYLFVLDYADSGTLKEYLKEKSKTFEWKDQLKFAKEIASAISCLHDNDILHRDLVSLLIFNLYIFLLNLIYFHKLALEEHISASKQNKIS